MKQSTRILILEDKATDADLAKHAIRQMLEDCEFQVAETRQEFVKALEEFQPDVILSDYSLPRFDGMKALKLAQKQAPLTPLIIWTGSISEDVAVDCMKAGANNYVLKENFKRLGPAVLHALEQRESRVARKQAKEELQNSEKRFRALIENGLDDISLLAADGSLLWESPSTVRNLGYAVGEFLGRNIFELMHPDDLEWTREVYTKLLQEPGSRQTGIFRLRHFDGTWRWVEAIATNMLEEASVKAIVINYRDITERKQANLELQQKNDDLGLLNAINEAVIRGQDLDSIVELLAKELVRIFSTQGNIIYSTIFMLTSDKKSIRIQKYFFPTDVRHNIEKLIGFNIPMIEIPIKEGGYFHKVLTSRRSAITSEPKAIQNWIAEFTETKFLHPLARLAVRKLIPQIYKLLNIKSLIVVPLIAEEEMIGFWNVSGSSLFTANDLKRFENIGGQLTAVIQRQQANEKIHRSEEFLHSIQNALSASIAILNEAGMIVQVNSAWREFGEQNGLTHPQYCIGLNYLEICDSARGPHAEEAPQVAQAIRAVIAGQISESRIEYPCPSPDMNRWFTLHITKFEDADQVWVVLAHEDITERKRAEEALRESEEHYRAIFEGVQDAIFVESVDGKILMVNERACEMFGYSRAEFLTKTVYDLVPQGQLMLLGDSPDISAEPRETVNLRANGEAFPIEISGRIQVINDEKVLLVVVRDITERKRAEAQLQISETRYRLATRATKDVIWEWNSETNQLVWAENAQIVFGYSPEEIGPAASWWDEHIHPEDRERVVSRVNTLTATVGGMSVGQMNTASCLRTVPTPISMIMLT